MQHLLHAVRDASSAREIARRGVGARHRWRHEVGVAGVERLAADDGRAHEVGDALIQGGDEVGRLVRGERRIAQRAEWVGVAELVA